MERGSIWRPNVEISPSCPRCGSSNTKFCYYNNYSLTQPRYFCKGCRRYWTKGGSLRNVPVGGGCRKSRRAKSSNNANANNCKNLTSCYNAVDSGSSSGGCGGGSNIDLALVYANFLNLKPESSKNDQLPTSTDHNSSEFVIMNTTNTSSLAVDSSGGRLLLPVENSSSSLLGPTWSTETSAHHHHHDDNHHHHHDDNHHHHHHDNHHHNRMLYAGFEQINDKNQSQDCKNGLPPLPGEELVCVNHQESSNFAWSEPPLMDNHSPVQVQAVQEPVVHFGDESDDQTNLLFGSWSPFDFSGDG